MKFKADHMVEQLHGCSQILQDIAAYADAISKKCALKELMITRVTDPVAGESGVHLEKRAFDARYQFDGGYYYKQEEVDYIEFSINKRFPRNDGKPTCMVHSFQGGMKHIHVQIPAVIPPHWPVLT